jgi:hypothetical protein
MPVYPRVKGLFIRMPRNAPEPLGERFRVAVRTATADLGTAPDRVPGCIRPLDAGMRTHAIRVGMTLRHVFFPTRIEFKQMTEFPRSLGS